MNNMTIGIASGVAGMAIGAVIGHYATKKQLQNRYDEMLGFEVDKVKEFYDIQAKGRLKNGDEPLTSEDIQVGQTWVDEQAAEKRKLLAELMSQEGYVESDPEEGVELKKQSVWDPERREEWDAEAKQSPPRGDDEPFKIITFNEFQYEEETYDKISIQYFAKDDTLTDEHGDPIPNMESNVGHDFVNWFGWNSGSPAIVHVRNKGNETDYEIAKSEGSYTEVILGIPDEEEFDRRPKKMRDHA